MKTNIAALMNLIAEEEKNITNGVYNVRTLAVSTSIQELDGTVNVIEDNKDFFDLELQELEDNIKKLSMFKATLYEKNNTFKLKDGRTIQQAIVDNTNLRKLKTCYEQLLAHKSSKKRFTEVNNSYFECRNINFDVACITQKLKEIDETIHQTDFEISKLNSVEFII